jgi:hypothetical protein
MQTPRERLELVKRRGAALAIPDKRLIVPEKPELDFSSPLTGSKLFGSQLSNQKMIAAAGSALSTNPIVKFTGATYKNEASSTTNVTVNIDLGPADTGGRAHANIIFIGHIEGAASTSWRADTGTELNGVHADDFYALHETLSTDGSGVRTGSFTWVTYNSDTGVKSCTLNLTSGRSGEFYFMAFQALYDAALSWNEGFFGRDELNEGTEPNTSQTMDSMPDGYIFGCTTSVNGGAPVWTPSYIDTGNTTKEGVSTFYDFDTSDEVGAAAMVADTGTTTVFWGNLTSEYISGWCYLSWDAAD